MGRSEPRPHAERVLSAIETDAARSALVASWRRSSALHGLAPDHRSPPRRLTAPELRAARERLEPLIRVAGASLDKLYQADAWGAVAGGNPARVVRMRDPELIQSLLHQEKFFVRERKRMLRRKRASLLEGREEAPGRPEAAPKASERVGPRN